MVHAVPGTMTLHKQLDQAKAPSTLRPKVNTESRSYSDVIVTIWHSRLRFLAEAYSRPGLARLDGFIRTSHTNQPTFVTNMSAPVVKAGSSHLEGL